MTILFNYLLIILLSFSFLLAQDKVHINMNSGISLINPFITSFDSDSVYFRTGNKNISVARTDINTITIYQKKEPCVPAIFGGVIGYAVITTVTKGSNSDNSIEAFSEGIAESVLHIIFPMIGSLAGVVIELNRNTEIVNDFSKMSITAQNDLLKRTGAFSR